jgi:hypothetical protein
MWRCRLVHGQTYAQTAPSDKTSVVTQRLGCRACQFATVLTNSMEQILLEKLAVAQLLKKFAAAYGIFIFGLFNDTVSSSVE